MSNKTRRTVIDLFAGCGGLSLGLEKAGFETIGFTEIGKDAAKTFIANRKKLSGINVDQEDPNQADELFPNIDPRYTRNTWSLTRKNGKRRGRKDCSRLDALLGTGKERVEVDLVVGGPPCQGYSRLGHRRTHAHNRDENPGNFLYESMAEVIEHAKPKMFVFENVQGLINAKWTNDSDCPGEVFEDVLRKFEKIGSPKNDDDYIIRWRLVRAYQYGVPQNRPRIIAIGIRRDVAEKLRNKKLIELKDFDNNKRRDKVFSRVNQFRDRSENCDAGFHPEPLWDPNGDNDEHAPPTPLEAIGDLIDAKYGKKSFESKEFAKSKYHDYKPEPKSYQEKMRKGMLKSTALTGHEYSNHSEAVIERFKKIIKAGKAEGDNKNKKFSQRVLGEKGQAGKKWPGGKPNMTVTSMPDDYVHFKQPRSLTVREWARLQTFPDSYEFQGKRTTGGIRRAGNPLEGIHEREVPQYTQIGNAVPPRLAEAIGNHLLDLLEQV
ncbi:MAG: DNA (cytosine-5-)-methyltransferase [Phycisphaerae bacterium]|nr:DNA (cytosine-5-)-methyltransferase [Phycisphaerae bacterium]